MDSILETIASTPLFDGLEKEHIAVLAGIARLQNFAKAEMIFAEGDPGRGFYIVRSGKVKIFKLSFGGKEQILHIYGPGKPFGEVPVFAGKNFPASAIAVTNATVIFLPRKEFIEVIATNSSLSLNMLAVLSMRLRQFTVMVENLSLKDVPARLASYLMVLEREQKYPASLKLPVSKNQLAGLLGTTPESVSRIFNRLSTDGVINIDRNVITIVDPDALADVAESG
ncbi:cAMP-bindin transcriptional regulator (Crp/Fnr family protein) [Desulfamplus magnetovallimortis]|uniref:cAMP-bindin transcriptional regulator (Crp/Fnr family protein) n=1 Tax=Desulfamplus magnetovallimortis TaxID=1246637 RepID=A0A1W1HIJ1_9BACT|nr:Crp/Fnr family transcriptional regulator [Desulfamplus magnetovallimortis]SLM32235.1 cAMP-bindin transcriptional regulator (Crp/Fnr family protein) [Desulfamplus magnetovallimortis]